MAAKQFTITVIPDVYSMAQYTGDLDALKTDLATFMTRSLAVYQASDGVSALVVYRDGIVAEVNVGQWVGYNFNQWQLYTDDQVQGTMNGGMTPVPDAS